MTELDIQEILFNRFKELNEISGKNYLKGDVNENYNNNRSFKIPADKRWWRVTFMSDRPVQTGLGEGSGNNYAGILQVDINTPLNKGEEEASTKFNYLGQVFYRGLVLDEVEVKTVYIADKSAESDYYRMTVRIEWEATGV